MIINNKQINASLWSKIRSIFFINRNKWFHLQISIGPALYPTGPITLGGFSDVIGLYIEIAQNSLIVIQLPHKHAIMGQYRAITRLMLPATAQYWPGIGPYRHVYREGNDNKDPDLK